MQVAVPDGWGPVVRHTVRARDLAEPPVVQRRPGVAEHKRETDHYAEQATQAPTYTGNDLAPKLEVGHLRHTAWGGKQDPHMEMIENDAWNPYGA